MEENDEEKRLREIKITQVMMANIRNKLDENLKNKKNKEKRERQKLREVTFNTQRSSNPRKTLSLNIHITDNNNKETINEDEKDITKTIASKNSTYSRLTRGDFFTNLIDNSFKIHRGNIKIGNRIHFFKTVLNSRDEKKDSENKILKLPEINDKKEEKKGFNEKEYFEELNKEHFEEFNKDLNRRKIKKEKNKNDIKVVIEQILDMVDYVYEHQKKSNSDLMRKNILRN